MEILTDLQKKILKHFSSLPDSEVFFLTGGTALSAFFLQHRMSNDLDFFTPIEEIILPFSLTLEASLKTENFNVERRIGLHSFVELSVSGRSDSTMIHLGQDSKFRFELPSPSEEFPGLTIDSLIDIATNKLLALFGRAVLRDFIDIYFLVSDRFSKNELMEKAKQKDPGFELYWLGVAMERIDDFSDDASDMHLLIRRCAVAELKEFYGVWRKEIASSITTGSSD